MPTPVMGGLPKKHGLAQTYENKALEKGLDIIDEYAKERRDRKSKRAASIAVSQGKAAEYTASGSAENRQAKDKVALEYAKWQKEQIDNDVNIDDLEYQSANNAWLIKVARTDTHAKAIDLAVETIEDKINSSIFFDKLEKDDRLSELYSIAYQSDKDILDIDIRDFDDVLTNSVKGWNPSLGLKNQMEGYELKKAAFAYNDPNLGDEGAIVRATGEYNPVLHNNPQYNVNEQRWEETDWTQMDNIVINDFRAQDNGMGGIWLDHWVEQPLPPEDALYHEVDNPDGITEEEWQGTNRKNKPTKAQKERMLLYQYVDQESKAFNEAIASSQINNYQNRPPTTTTINNEAFQKAVDNVKLGIETDDAGKIFSALGYSGTTSNVQIGEKNGEKVLMWEETISEGAALTDTQKLLDRIERPDGSQYLQHYETIPKNMDDIGSWVNTIHGKNKHKPKPEKEGEGILNDTE